MPASTTPRGRSGDTTCCGHQRGTAAACPRGSSRPVNMDAARPVSTGEGTRRVRLLRGGGGGGRIIQTRRASSSNAIECPSKSASSFLEKTNLLLKTPSQIRSFCAGQQQGRPGAGPGTAHQQEAAARVGRSTRTGRARCHRRPRAAHARRAQRPGSVEEGQTKKSSCLQSSAGQGTGAAGARARVRGGHAPSGVRGGCL